MKPADLVRRVFACVAAAVLVAATFAPLDADARAGKGGSFGSRGSRTYDAPPPTATTPGGAQSIQRSTTQPGAPGMNSASPSSAAAGATQRRGGLFGGGLMGGLMGGLLGAGLFGLLSGSGFFGGLGSLASLLGLVIQVALVVLVVRFALNWFRRSREQGGQTAASSPTPIPAGAGASASSYGAPQPTSVNADRFQYPGSGAGSSQPYGGGSYGEQQGGSYGGQPAGEVTISADDYAAFERLLAEVQEAWTRQDLGALRGLATPEMVQIFADDLAEHASDGVANKVSNVKLLQGDLAEAWNENGRDYATVSMRYSLVDVTQDVRTGEVVDGDPHNPTEATELWTFMRTSGGRGNWLLSAVQQAQEERKGLFGGLFG